MHEHTAQLRDRNKDQSGARQLTGCCVGSVAPRDLKNFAAFTRWSFRPLRKRPSRAASIVGAGTLSSAACCTVHLPAHSAVLVSCWSWHVNRPATVALRAPQTAVLAGHTALQHHKYYQLMRILWEPCKLPWLGLHCTLSSTLSCKRLTLISLTRSEYPNPFTGHFGYLQCPADTSVLIAFQKIAIAEVCQSNFRESSRMTVSRV